jgi:pimeloyl-ACP methyl ester carboxylesterase
VLHEAGGSARGLDELLGGFIGARPIYAPDLPGHGESDPPICDGPLIDGPLIDGMVAQLDRAVDAIGLSDLDLVALGDGAALALAWAALNPGRIVSVTLCNPAVVPAARIESFAQGLAPALTPDWAGGHLLTAWHAARDRDMFWPWFDKSPAAALPLGIPASDAIVQQRVIDLFKAEATHAPLAAALTRAPLLDMLRRCSAPLRLFASTEQPVFPDLTALCAIAALPARPLNWAPVILGALDTDRTTP